MIKYSLICDKEHSFEGWFSSSGDFDTQQKRGLVTCPFCNSGNITKSLMAPSISTSKTKTAPPGASQEETPDNLPVTTTTQIPAQVGELITKMREWRTQIQANSENVGTKFPEEARKIHYGEAEKRGIYGQASVHDVKELTEEGVEVMPLPVLPEDRN